MGCNGKPQHNGLSFPPALCCLFQFVTPRARSRGVTHCLWLFKAAWLTCSMFLHSRWLVGCWGHLLCTVIVSPSLALLLWGITRLSLTKCSFPCDALTLTGWQNPALWVLQLFPCCKPYPRCCKLSVKAVEVFKGAKEGVGVWTWAEEQATTLRPELWPWPVSVLVMQDP